jgi:hypothetical protein
MLDIGVIHNGAIHARGSKRRIGNLLFEQGMNLFRDVRPSGR